MWMILQHETPEDFVIATGEQHTVRDFTEKAFKANGIEIRWEGTGLEEKGYDKATGKMLVCVNPEWFRPTDVDNLWGDPTNCLLYTSRELLIITSWLKRLGIP